MLWQRFVRHVLFIATIPVLLPNSAQADFGKLLEQIPGDANALVMIRADKIFNSPMAKELGWQMGLNMATAEQPLVVPPGTRLLVMGSRFNLASMEPIWEIALVDMERAPSLDVITRIDGGYIDHFGDTEAAWTPLNTYFVRLSDHLVGAVFPADRQRVSAWIKKSKSAKGNSLRSYLKHGASFTDKGADIVMVLDLNHALGARGIAQKLEDFAAMSGKEDMVESVSKVVADIRGITLRVEVGKKTQGKITIHFKNDTSMLKDLAKPLLLEVLDRQGATIPDIADWQSTVTSSGKTVILKGELSVQGMRRLLSMTELPMPSSDSSEAKPGSNGGAPSDPKAEASVRYFKTLISLIKDLRESRKGSTLGRTDGVWIGRYARKIYRLPILNVDEDLQQYGADVAGSLLQAVDVIEENAQQIKAEMAAIHGGGKYYGGKRYARSWGGRGGRYSDANAAMQQNRNRQQAMTADRIKRINERKQIRKEGLARGTMAAREIIDGIRGMTLKIRQLMTDRYRVEF